MLSIAVLLCLFCVTEPAVIIFDVGGVLVDLSRVRAIFSIGLFSVFGEALSFKIKHPFSDCINHIRETFWARPLEELSRYAEATDGMYRDMAAEETSYEDDGVRASALEVSYWSGKMDSETFIALRDAWFKTHPNCFRDERDREFFTRVANTAFNPREHIRLLHLLPCIELLHECAKQKKSDGGKKNLIIICSNWDRESFNLLKQRYQKQIFDFVDAVVVSGDVHCVKPNAAIFDICLNVVKAHPEYARESFFFIDDQACNRTGAQKAFAAHAMHIECAHPDKAYAMLGKGNVIALPRLGW